LDAQRNRERILEVAKEAFTRFGAEASLDDVAKQAGVGAGTLYRHFPTRDALIEAVYRSEVEKLAAAESKFAGNPVPGRSVASLDAVVRRPHRREADHCPRIE
jgi:AcrR family transcriptional regulator